MSKAENIRELLSLDLRCENSFSPNLTSGLIYHHIKTLLLDEYPNTPVIRLLELGCGSGVISLALKRHFQERLEVSLSDIVESSTKDAGYNFRNNDLSANIKTGDLFSCWDKCDRFDVIGYDVTGIASDVAKISPWFDKAYYGENDTGVEHLCRFLKHLTFFDQQPQMIVFPVLSLSAFWAVPSLDEFGYREEYRDRTYWPLDNTHFDQNSLNVIRDNGYEVTEKFGVPNAWTVVVIARNVASN